MTLKVLVKDTAQCLSNLMKCYAQADLVEGEAQALLAFREALATLFDI